LVVISALNATNGTAVHNANGSITFTPAANFNGTAGFDYTVSDGTLTDIGHVTVNVSAVNDAPVAVDDTASTNEDTAVIVTQATMVSNDTDAEGSTRHGDGSVESDQRHGRAECHDRRDHLHPAANFSGTGGFDYTVSDGALNRHRARHRHRDRQSMTRVAVDDTTSTPEDHPGHTYASATGCQRHHPDGNTLTVTAGVQTPTNGRPCGTRTAPSRSTPTANFSGTGRLRLHRQRRNSDRHRPRHGHRDRRERRPGRI
jgi:hypothetical protein